MLVQRHRQVAAGRVPRVAAKGAAGLEAVSQIELVRRHKEGLRAGLQAQARKAHGTGLRQDVQQHLLGKALAAKACGRAHGFEFRMLGIQALDGAGAHQRAIAGTRWAWQPCRPAMYAGVAEFAQVQCVHALRRRGGTHVLQMLLHEGFDARIAQVVQADPQVVPQGVHGPRPQNKKYRCAMGSTVAGSQVSSWPSARTV